MAQTTLGRYIFFNAPAIGKALCGVFDEPAINADAQQMYNSGKSLEDIKRKFPQVVAVATTAMVENGKLVGAVCKGFYVGPKEKKFSLENLDKTYKDYLNTTAAAQAR